MDDETQQELGALRSQVNLLTHVVAALLPALHLPQNRRQELTFATQHADGGLLGKEPIVRAVAEMRAEPAEPKTKVTFGHARR